MSDDNKVNSLISAATDPGNNVWAEIGGLFEAKAFNRRVNALTNPEAYAKARTEALDAIKKASETAFKTANTGYIAAGLSPELAKENAMMSAKSEYANQLRVFNLQYGQGTDAIFNGAAANSGPMAAVRNVMAPARRAPARRAPARRSSTTSSAASRSAAAKKGAATKRRKAAAAKKKK